MDNVEYGNWHLWFVFMCVGCICSCCCLDCFIGKKIKEYLKKREEETRKPAHQPRVIFVNMPSSQIRRILTQTSSRTCVVLNEDPSLPSYEEALRTLNESTSQQQQQATSSTQRVTIQIEEHPSSDEDEHASRCVH